MVVVSKLETARIDDVVRALCLFAGDPDLKTQLRQVCERHPRLCELRPETISANAETLARIMGMTPQRTVRFALPCPSLFYQWGESIEKRIDELSKKLQVSRSAFIKSVRNDPAALVLSPDTAQAKLKDIARRLHFTHGQVVTLFRKNSGLLTLTTDTVVDKVNGLAELFCTDTQTVWHMACRRPQILARSLASVKAVIDTMSTTLDQPIKAIQTIIIRHADLLMVNPRNPGRNITELAKLLDVERDLAVAAAMKCPPIFYLRPVGIADKLDSMADKLDIPRATMTKVFLRMPSLGSRKPATIAQRVRLIARIARALGQQYSHPEILTTSPAAPTYSTERLLLRYLVARLGLWNGKWSSLIQMRDQIVRDKLQAHLDELSPTSLEAKRLKKIIAKRLLTSD